GVIIAICVLSGLAGICAVVVCVRYVRTSESRSLRTAQSVKSILDEDLRKVSLSRPRGNVSRMPVNDKPPPYSYNADLRPVSMIL
ncbi:hypothetical protein M408DRAFT_66442, partial [Serendipita vermifera MAFF 305830]